MNRLEDFGYQNDFFYVVHHKKVQMAIYNQLPNPILQEIILIFNPVGKPFQAGMQSWCFYSTLTPDQLRLRCLTFSTPTSKSDSNTLVFFQL